MAENSINEYQLIVIGGSAGSLDVLLHVIPKLKANFHIPIVLVLHRMNSYDSTLTELIAAKTTLKVKEVEDKEPIKAGNIYIAPADYHLLIEKDGMFSLDFSEKINFSRPSIDITFASAADAFGERTLGILLSGANADGVDGMQAIKNAGGLAVVQDPKTAEVSFMPAQAILNIEVDKILKIDEIPDFLNSLA